MVERIKILERELDKVKVSRRVEREGDKKRETG